jgi:predicted dehydrogenase
VYEVEDLAAGFVRFANGATLQIETSWASHTRPNRDEYFTTLYGSEGGCELDVNNYTDRDTVSFSPKRPGGRCWSSPISSRAAGTSRPWPIL